MSNAAWNILGFVSVIVIVSYFVRAWKKQKQNEKQVEELSSEVKINYPLLAEFLKQVDSRNDWVCHFYPNEGVLHFFVPSLKKGFTYVKFPCNDLKKIEVKQVGFYETNPDLSHYIVDEIIDLKYALRKEYRRKKTQQGGKIKLGKRETAALFGWTSYNF